MDRPPLHRRISAIVASWFIGNYSWQLVGAFGGSSVITAVESRLVSAAGWLGGPYLVLAGVGTFCLAFAILGAYLPRAWSPKSPLARYFGTTAVLVGISEDLDRRIFRRTPELKRECEHVIGRLHRFVEDRRKEMPPLPVRPAPGQDPPRDEQNRYDSRVAEVQAKTLSIYNDSWKRRVDRLFEDARAMFFGPALPDLRYFRGEMESMEAIIAFLERLAVRMPSTYTDEFHAARVEKLRRVKQEGLGLAHEIREFANRRQREASDLSAQVMEEQRNQKDGDPFKEAWQRDRNFDAETSAQFLGQFGGRLKHMWEQLRDFGLYDEVLDRLFGSWHLTLHTGEIPALGLVMSALCQRIPYD